jgi:quercetin dioxygenase-like cupin family protein
LNPGEGSAVDIGTGSRCTFKVTGRETGGRFGLFEWTMEPGAFGPKPHIHKKMEEMFYVVEGAVELHIGERTIKARAGTFALVPRRIPHGFSNPSSSRDDADHFLPVRLARKIL